MSEKLQIDYDYLLEYFETALNVVGSTTSTTLRTIASHNNTNTKYVRKFGLDYEITDVTDIEDPIDVNMKFLVYALDGTLLGSRVGGGAFVDGAVVSAQGCYLEIEASGGAVTVLTGIDIGTDVDPGGKTFVCAAESVADGDTLRLYLSDTTSTYYDSKYKYGGARHVSTGTASLPYFDPNSAYATLAGAFVYVAVLDSETYDYEFIFNIASTKVFAVLGQTPALTSGIGARITRETNALFNNSSTSYFNENGDDANNGSWQAPKLTFAAAISLGKGIIYGGIGATAFGGIFTETVAINLFLKIIEADYGYCPTIRGNITILNANSFNGFKVDGQNSGTGILIAGGASFEWIRDNTIFNCPDYGINYTTVDDGKNLRNIIFNCGTAILRTASSANRIVENLVEKNIIYDCNTGIMHTWGAAGYLIFDIDYTNNIFYNNGIAIHFDLNVVVTPNDGTVNGAISNNLFFQNEYAILLSPGTGAQDWFFNSQPADNIFINNSIHGINSDIWLMTISYCNFYGNGTDYNGNVTSNNEIAGDPKLCKITTPYKFGLGADSPCLKADGSENDIGPELKTIIIGANDIEINGFIIDGQESYNNGIATTGSSDYTGTLIYWCSIYDYQGIGNDIYSGASTNAEIKNCLIYYNGNGIKFTMGGNSCEENVLYRNSIFNIHSDYTVQTFNHLAIYGGQYGLYFESNSSGITFKNSIISGQSLYSIFSEVSLTVIYSCIKDRVNPNVDISATSNTVNEPLFFDVTEGSEDLHIKTKFSGFSNNSPCYLGADDTYDMGAYKLSRGVQDEAWKKFVVDSNPTNLDDENRPKDLVDSVDALGSGSLWAKAHKLYFPLIWSENAYTTEHQWKMIKYLTSLIPTRELGKTKINTRMRIRLLPITHMENGTSGVIDASALTLTDSNKAFEPNDHKGFQLAVIFLQLGSMSINASAKTATVVGAGLTVDQYIGYYLKYNGYTYYIKSNTTEILSLSDPYSTLADAVNQTLSIEKYFEIKSNDETGMVLYDEDGELVDGTYNYYVDFSLVRNTNSMFASKQPLFKADKHEWKSGYQLLLEQV